MVRMNCACACTDATGERLAIEMLVSRAFASSRKYERDAIVLYSVYDGRILHTQKLSGDCVLTSGPCCMEWVDFDVRARPSQALQMLSELAPLAPVADQAWAHAPTSTMAPHMASQARKNHDECPSASIAGGRGALAGIPVLPRRQIGDEGRSSLLYVFDRDARVHLLLDGTIYLGCASAGHGRGIAVHVHSGGMSLTVLSHDDAGAVRASRVDMPLRDPAASLDMRSSMLHLRPVLQHLVQLSSALQEHLVLANDAAYLAGKAYNQLVRPRLVEWCEHLRDVSKRYATDTQLELMTTLTTGRAALATEQLLLHNVTEMVRLQWDTTLTRRTSSPWKKIPSRG